MSVYLYIYLSSICLPTYLSIRLSVSSVLYQNCSFWTVGASFPRLHTACIWLPFLSTVLLTAVPLQDSWPPWAVLSLPGTISLLPQAALLFRAKTDTRESEQLCSVYPWQSACYGKWTVNLFSICFLVTFLIYVIRGIQCIFTLCPFIIVLPPILQRKMFLLHNSPYFKTSDKAAARHTVIHMLTPPLRISIIILSVKKFLLCAAFFSLET